MCDFLHPQAPVSGTRPQVPQGKTPDNLCPQAPVPGTRSPVPLPCLPSNGISVSLRLPKSTRQKRKTTPVSFHPPGAGGRGTRVPLSWGLYLTLSQGAGFLQVWMWSGCCPVSSGLYFRKSFLCYIFIALCVLGRRFPLLYSRRHPGSASLPLII